MAFDVDIRVFVSELGPEAAKMLAEAGQEEKDTVETEQQGRRGIRPVTYIAIDGVPAIDFSSVKPESVIFEYWDYRAEIIKAAFDELQARSPMLSGNYRNSFYAILDGKALGYLEVPDAQTLENVKRIEITNNVIYARRLEVGVTESGESFAKQVDPHIVESAAKPLAEEFGSMVRITFNFIDLEGAPTSGLGWRAIRARKLGGKKQSGGKAIRYPAIIIEQV